MLSCKHSVTRHKCKMVDGGYEPTSDHITTYQVEGHAESIAGTRLVQPRLSFLSHVAGDTISTDGANSDMRDSG